MLWSLDQQCRDISAHVLNGSGRTSFMLWEWRYHKSQLYRKSRSTSMFPIWASKIEFIHQDGDTVYAEKDRKWKNQSGHTWSVALSSYLCWNPSLRKPTDSLFYTCIFKLILGFGLVWFGLQYAWEKPQVFYDWFPDKHIIVFTDMSSHLFQKREILWGDVRFELYRYDMSQN